MQPVAWEASLGHDVAGREAPLLAAVRAGHLQPDHAVEMLPYRTSRALGRDKDAQSLPVEFFKLDPVAQRILSPAREEQLIADWVRENPGLAAKKKAALDDLLRISGPDMALFPHLNARQSHPELKALVSKLTGKDNCGDGVQP
jgi:hypothetical protein